MVANYPDEEDADAPSDCDGGSDTRMRTTTTGVLAFRLPNSLWTPARSRFESRIRRLSALRLPAGSSSPS